MQEKSELEKLIDTALTVALAIGAIYIIIGAYIFLTKVNF
jgi:hypothetical protein